MKILLAFVAWDLLKFAWGLHIEWWSIKAEEFERDLPARLEQMVTVLSQWEISEEALMKWPRR